MQNVKLNPQKKTPKYFIYFGKNKYIKKMKFIQSYLKMISHQYIYKTIKDFI